MMPILNPVRKFETLVLSKIEKMVNDMVHRLLLLLINCADGFIYIRMPHGARIRV